MGRAPQAEEAGCAKVLRRAREFRVQEEAFRAPERGGRPWRAVSTAGMEACPPALELLWGESARAGGQALVYCQVRRWGMEEVDDGRTGRAPIGAGQGGGGRQDSLRFAEHS